MTVLLFIVGFAATLGVMILRALALDEVKGRIQRRVTKSVEATIASLPAAMQDEWAEEWRAEIAAVITMPLTAARTAQGLRQSASELMVNPALVPAGVGERMPPLPSTPSRLRAIRLANACWLVELAREQVRFGVAVAAVAVVVAVGVAVGVGASPSSPSSPSPLWMAPPPSSRASPIDRDLYLRCLPMTTRCRHNLASDGPEARSIG